MADPSLARGFLEIIFCNELCKFAAKSFGPCCVVAPGDDRILSRIISESLPSASGLVRARLARLSPWNKSAQESGSKLISPSESRLLDLWFELSKYLCGPSWLRNELPEKMFFAAQQDR